MPLFHYKAKDKEGRDAEGEREGKDKYDLARALRAEGMTPLFILEAGGASGGKKTLNDHISNFFKRISLEEKFKIVILAMVENIKKGKNFSDAIGEHPEVFPKFYQEMARAGEKSGKLEESLKLVALQLKKDYMLRRKIRGAMVYPAIVVAAMVGIGILMLIYVVPTLVSTFNELKVELPLSTRFIIFISQSILESGAIFLLAAAVIGYALFRWSKSKNGKERID